MQAIGVPGRKMPGFFERQQQQFGIVQLHVIARQARERVSQLVKLRRLVGDSVLARERKDFLLRGTKLRFGSDLVHVSSDSHYSTTWYLTHEPESGSKQAQSSLCR